MIKPIDHQSANNFCAGSRRAHGRLHLPVAPRAQARIRFSPEKALPRALTPEQALNWLDYLNEQGQVIKVINVNGPGDPLATPELTLQTMGMIRDKYPGVSMCLTTLGLGAGQMAGQLAELGLAHVSILMDAVDAKTAEKIYAWIRPGTKTIPLAQAAQMLMDEQAAAIRDLSRAGVKVYAKTTVYPRINEEQAPLIAEKAASLGADQMKLFPFVPKGEDCPRPTKESSPEELHALAKRTGQYLPTQVMDLASCRELAEEEIMDPALNQALLPKPDQKRPNLAVCSSDGFEVDLHLGQAGQFLIYGPQDGPVVLLEARPAPEPGEGDYRWRQVALALSDCFAVLTAAAGQAPKRVLSENGLPVLIQEGNVEGLVDTLYGGGKKKKGCQN